MADLIPPPRSNPTVVEGVVQFSIPIAPADIKSLLPEITKLQQLSDTDLADHWVTYSARRLLRTPTVQSIPRFGNLLPASTPIDQDSTIDVIRFISTARDIKVIESREYERLSDEWSASRVRMNPGKFLLRHKKIADLFYGIHLIDFHLQFIEGAKYYEIIKEDDYSALRNVVSSLDPNGL